jgi:hypothetical protein
VAVAVVTGTSVVGWAVGAGVACWGVVWVQPATTSRSTRNAMPPKINFIFIYDLSTCEILRVACGRGKLPDRFSEDGSVVQSQAIFTG